MTPPALHFHRRCIAACLLLFTAAAHAFDHDYASWQRLLQQHVRWVDDGVASQVDYRGLQNRRDELQHVLQLFSQVSPAEFDRWPPNQRLAFLINAYNAFTIELILSRYPKLQSIKDLGSLFRSPWKKKFFTLLGAQRHLDNIEHDLIRGHFREPRIHVAVVCASIGCPALRPEPFTAARLDPQLNDSMRRFLSDASRNRYNPQTGKLEVSSIFKWYGDDFKGQGGYASVSELFAAYADVLARGAAARQRIRNGAVNITYLDYDWRLNDARDSN